MGMSFFGLLAGMMLLFTSRSVSGSSTDVVNAPVNLGKYISRRENGDLWFTEADEFWPGQAFSMKVDEIVFQGQSKYQDILVFKNARYGNVLVLDGAIQYTTKDQSSYQEMMTHTPMNLCPNGTVKEVLVIGGGDGGVLRELAKYPEIEKIHICEIDQGVIDCCKAHLPEASCGFFDPRVEEHVEDGFDFLERMGREGKKFDVIVSDLSDPIGPAGSIYGDKFIKLLSDSLNAESGVASLQGECFWLHEPLIQKLVTEAKQEFQDVQYANIAIPTYPCGTIGMILMCKNGKTKANLPVRDIASLKKNLSYYNQELHGAQFVLPEEQKEKVYGPTV